MILGYDTTRKKYTKDNILILLMPFDMDFDITNMRENI